MRRPTTTAGHCAWACAGVFNAAVFAFQGAGCESRGAATAWDDHAQRTCLVLSVGGVKGIAHLGAIEAVKDLGVRVDCVVGTSFGALAGSIYASAPAENTPERYSRFMNNYVTKTKEEKEGGALTGAILGAATGGAGWLLGAAIGADAVNERDRKRFVSVLDTFYGAQMVERLPIRFATLYQERTSTGFRVVTVTSGDVANAVGHSAANPFIFQDVDPKADKELDPGLDRVAAVPVEDACKLYPDARLIAINVTGTPAFFSSSMHCPLLEVRIDTPPVGGEALLPGPAFDALVKVGFNATREALTKTH